VRESLDIRVDEREIAIHPADRLRNSRTRLIPGTFIGRQTISRSLHRQTFTEEIARGDAHSVFSRRFSALRVSRAALGAVWTTPSWWMRTAP